MKTIEEKAKAYDEAIKRGLDYIRHTPATEMVTCQDIFEAIFPEFKEPKDEKIRKGIIELVKQSSEILDKQNQNNMIAWLEKQNPAWSEKDKNLLNRLIGVLDGTNEEDYHEAWEETFLPWLKSIKERMQPQPKQSEQSTDKIEPNLAWSEEDEEMLKWLCRIIHTQRLNRAITLKEESELGEWMDKWLNHNPQTKQCEHLENYDEEQEKIDWSTITDDDIAKVFSELPTVKIEKDEDERIIKGLITAVSRIFEGHKLFDTDVTREEALAWLEKQEEPNPYSGTSFKYNGHIWGMCARDNGVEILFDGELKAFLSLEKSFIYPIYPKPDLAHKSAIEAIKDNIGNNNKVKPKFHEGEWITNGDYTWKIVEVKPLDYILQSQDGNIVDDTISYVDEQFRSFTIEDAKDGDVLVDEYNNIGLYSGEKDDLYWHSYIYLGCDDYLKCSMGYHKHKNTKPATKEQRDLLFQKMKQEGYEWDAKNKKLSKQSLKITPKFCVGQLITDNNGNWYKITNIKCLDDWYYELYDVCEDNTHLELCSIIDEKFRENRFAGEIKKMMGD